VRNKYEIYLNLKFKFLHTILCKFFNRLVNKILTSCVFCQIINSIQGFKLLNIFQYIIYIILKHFHFLTPHFNWVYENFDGWWSWGFIETLVFPCKPSHPLPFLLSKYLPNKVWGLSPTFPRQTPLSKYSFSARSHPSMCAEATLLVFLCIFTNSFPISTSS